MIPTAKKEKNVNDRSEMNRSLNLKMNILIEQIINNTDGNTKYLLESNTETTLNTTETSLHQCKEILQLLCCSGILGWYPSA
jgi:hypothetical protein